jgi:cytochrome c5
MQNRNRILSLLFLTVATSVALHANTSTIVPIPAKDVHAASQTVPANDKAAATTEETANRGQLLYENHCRKCHESQVYIRQQRKAHSLKDIRSWTRQWSTELKLDWTAADVEQVSQYLNRQFYHFPDNNVIE